MKQKLDTDTAFEKDASQPSEVLGLLELVSLSALGKLTGPKGKDFIEMLDAKALLSLVDSSVADADTYDVLERVVSTYNRRLNKRRGALPSVELGRDLAERVSRVMVKIHEEAPGYYADQDLP